MRRSMLLATAVFAITLAACAKKPQNGECKTSEDCLEQVGYGKVCVQGQCQECGADTDCKAGFVCRANKCQPRPECESPADCAAGKTCQDGRCVSAWTPGTCDAEHPCPSDQDCMGGRCVAKPAPVEPVKGPCDDLGSVYFAFDRADLTAESRATLERNARCVLDRAAKGFRVEGNCDERGTSEYNMHLGQRRADSVKKYLSGLGVPAKAISTVSFGKEKPICGEATKDCWQRNRRADVKAQ
jgi:peptidoglycan-associated lipoprotein